MENTEYNTILPIFSDNEYEVMLLFWQEDRPLTSGDILKLSEGTRSWHPKSAAHLLNNLVKKGYIEPAGTLKEGRFVSQLFKIKRTQTDYYLTRFDEILGASEEKCAIALDVVSAFLSRYCQLSPETLNQIQELINTGA